MKDTKNKIKKRPAKKIDFKLKPKIKSILTEVIISECQQNNIHAFYKINI